MAEFFDQVSNAEEHYCAILKKDNLKTILGVLHLERGLESARKIVHRCLIEGQDLAKLYNNTTDSISKLHRYARARGWEEPVYSVRETSGQQSQKLFKIEVTVDGIPWGLLNPAPKTLQRK